MSLPENIYRFLRKDRMPSHIKSKNNSFIEAIHITDLINFSLGIVNTISSHIHLIEYLQNMTRMQHEAWKNRIYKEPNSILVEVEMTHTFQTFPSTAHTNPQVPMLLYIGLSSHSCNNYQIEKPIVCPSI